MGNFRSKVNFTSNVESLCGSGLRSVVSEPIDGFSAEMFWAIFETFIRVGPDPKPKGLEEYEATEVECRGAKDKKFVIKSTLSAFSIKTFTRVCIHSTKDGAETYFYGTDETLKDMQHTHFFRTHCDPFRLEVWVMVGEERRCGEVISGALQVMLYDIGYPVKLTINADSIAEPGFQSIVSDPIEGMTPELFWDLFEVYYRKRPPKEHETEVSSRDLPDGSFVQAVRTGAEVQYSFNTAVLRADQNDCVFQVHLTDETLSYTAWYDYVRVHRDPFRLELWSEVPPMHFSGIYLREFCKKMLFSVLGYAVDATADTSSIWKPGKKCVLSESFEDASLTKELFFQRVNAFIVSEGGVEEPDGTILTEYRSWLAPTRWAQSSTDVELGEITIRDYLDPSLSTADLLSTTYWKLHENPMRVEVFMVTKEGRIADELVRIRLGHWLAPIIDKSLAYA